MAGETAAGGGRIDGWHIISLLIAAPQNWIASRGLWSVRIWLMSPTPLLSSDSSLLSGPGLGFLSFPLTAIPPPLYPLPPPRCLYLDSVSGEEATKGLLTRSVRPPLFLPRSRSPVLLWPLSVFLYLFPQFLLKCCMKVKENLSSNVSLQLKTTKWVSKLFLFGNQICHVFVRDVYYFVTGVTKAATQGRSESQLPEWFCSRFYKVVLGWNGAMLWHNALVHSHKLCAAFKYLSRSGC